MSSSVPTANPIKSDVLQNEINIADEILSPTFLDKRKRPKKAKENMKIMKFDIDS